jgi:hypothetical protein
MIASSVGFKRLARSAPCGRVRNNHLLRLSAMPAAATSIIVVDALMRAKLM